MNTERSARGARTLPAEFYTSPEIFAAETREIFETHWQCVGRAELWDETGLVQLVQVEGESLIVLRAADGRLRCYHNVCRHRGTQLCEHSGEQLTKAITCPYHAWSYDFDGNCLAAPNMHEVPGFEKSDYPLKSAAVTECQGFVFVSLASEPPPVEEALGPLGERLGDWQAGALQTAATLEYDVACNWKLLFQNYNECYHCPRVHPALNAISSYDTAANDFEDGAVLGGPMRLGDGVASMTATGAACAPTLPGLPEPDAKRVYYFTVFPNLFVSPHPDFVMTHRLSRLGPDRTRIVCEFLFHPDATRAADFDPSPAVTFWDETNRQDWKVCELSQRGVSSRAYEPGPYSNLECTLAAFDRHYLTVLGRDGDT